MEGSLTSQGGFFPRYLMACFQEATLLPPSSVGGKRSPGEWQVAWKPAMRATPAGNQLDIQSLFALVVKNINSRMNHDQRRQ